MSLHQLLLILRARWRSALLTLLACGALALAWVLLTPPRYRATTTVVADVRAPDQVAGTVFGTVVAPAWLPTQVDILNSERIALKVVRLLNLDQDPAARAAWERETDGRGNLQAWLVEVLKSRLEVMPSRDSNVIAISYESSDPVSAANVANAFAQAYMALNVDMKVEPARQTAEWFADQARTARETLERAQARISEYQQKKGLVATDERLDVETSRLADLAAQLSAVQGAADDAASKQRAATRGLESLPEALQNGLIINLRTQIAAAESRLRETAGRVGENHPDFDRQAAALAALRSQLDTEMARLGRSFGVVRGAGRDHEATLRTAIDRQKRTLLELKHQRAELGVLLREGEVAQRAYDAIAQRHTQTSLESQATQPSVLVLTTAVPPVRAASPNPVLATVLAVVGGSLLALLMAFGRELADRRVRTRDDLEVQLGLPVLVRLPARAATTRWREHLAISGPLRRLPRPTWPRLRGAAPAPEGQS